MSVATVSSLTSSSKDGLSPTQKLFGHLVQDILPAHQCSFLPQWQQPVQEAAIRQMTVPNLLQHTTTSIPTTCQTFMLCHMLQFKIITVNYETLLGSYKDLSTL